MAILRRGASRLAAFMVACLGAVSACEAAELSDPAPGHPAVTYFDIVKLLIPDLAPDGRGGASGSVLLPKRTLEQNAPRAQNPTVVAPRAIRPMDWPQPDSRQSLIVELAPAQGTDDTSAILMLVDLEREPRLLDAVQLSDDASPETRVSVVGELGERSPLFALTSERNSRDGRVAATQLAFIRDGRLTPIAGYSTLEEAACGFHRSQAAQIKATGAANPYRTISVSIVDHVAAADASNCGGKPKIKPGDKVYATAFVWSRSTQRFEPSNRDISLLEGENKR